MQPFIKVIPPGSQDFGTPQVQLVKRSSRGLLGNDLRAFVKRAGHPLAEQVRRMEKHAGEELIHLIAMGSTESYGCFFQGTPVQTEHGLKPIEEVAVGDQVLTHQNRYRPVTHTFQKDFSGDRASLTVSGLPYPIVSTANHPFWVVRRSDFGIHDRCACFLEPRGLTKAQAVDNVMAGKAQFVDANTLQKGDYLIVPINPTLPGAETLKPEDAYLTGVYLAEGCVSNSYKPGPNYQQPRGMVLSVSTDDRGVLERIRQDTGRHVGEGVTYTSLKGIRATINDPVITRQCRRLVGDYSTHKRISPVIFTQSREWKLNFLAGYFDGDGCVTNSSGKARYQGTLRGSTASLNLALDLQRLLAGLGIPCKVTRLTNRRSNGCFGGKDFPIYEVSIGSAYSEVILDQCVRLKYPQDLPKRNKQSHGQCGTNYLLLPITKVCIDWVEGETKYNLEVEDDNTYTTYTISHNSNRNGDGFREQPLIKYHPTFVKHARWYRAHRNQDKAQSYGVVPLSTYHPELHRVELIVGLNATKEAAERNGGLIADKELQKLAANEELPVSMSTRVPHDLCNGCGNKARNRSEYCTEDTCSYGGLKHNITKVAEDGLVLHADNPICTFFDISHVWKPADRVAYVLGRVKTAAGLWKSGALLAEEMELGCPPEVQLEGLLEQASPAVRPQLEALCKLASAETALDNTPERSARQISNRALGLYAARSLKEAGVALQKGPALWALLASKQILLPVGAFLELQGQSKQAGAVSRLLPGIFGQLLGQDNLESRLSESPYRLDGRRYLLKEALDIVKLASAYSLERWALQDRAWRAGLGNVPAPAWRVRRPTSVKSAALGSGGLTTRWAEEYALYQVGFLAGIPSQEQARLAPLSVALQRVNPQR